MKIKPQTEAFARILEITRRAVKPSATVPVLSGVLVEADKDKSVLTVSATDMEISIQVTAGQCEVEEGGKAVIRAGLLSEVVKSMDDEQVDISASASEATIATEKGSYSINAYKASDFPKLPAFPTEGGSYFAVEAGALAASIEKVLPFTSNDHLRPVLGGVLVAFEDETLTMAATDSYRLGVATKALEGGPAEEVSQIIPARGLKEVSRLASMTEKIFVSITDKQAMFTAQGVTIATRLIDGNFPEFKRLIPDQFERTFRVSRKPLVESLKRVNLFCGKTNPPTPVRLSFNAADEEAGSLMGDELVIAGSSSEIGTGQEILGFSEDASENKEPFVVAFNPTYLMSAVATTGAEEVLIKVNEPLKPAMVFPAETPEDAPETRFLLMPMRDPNAEQTAKPTAKETEKKAAKQSPPENDKASDSPEAPEAEEVPAG